MSDNYNALNKIYGQGQTKLLGGPTPYSVGPYFQDIDHRNKL